MTSILIQARLSSTRFPGKMLENIGNTSLINYIYQRCLTSTIAQQVVVITSIDPTDDPLFQYCIERGIPVERGDLNDVLMRYLTCAESLKTNIICRVCGDSPFVDIDGIDNGFKAITENPLLEYVSTSNTLNGFMSEVFTIKTLRKIASFTTGAEDREHVTKFLRDNPSLFTIKYIDMDLKPDNLVNFTLTVDYPSDLEIVKKITSQFKGYNFKSHDIIDLLYKLKVNRELHCI